LATDRVPPEDARLAVYAARSRMPAVTVRLLFTVWLAANKTELGLAAVLLIVRL